MQTVSEAPLPAASRTAGLVSVDGRAYPLESARIEVLAEGGVAATTLTQVYRNPYAEPLEVLYTLPLPADGAVVGYTIRLGEKEIVGEVRRRREAEKEYRKALIDGRTAALLEQDRDDTFLQRLGALPAGVKAEVAIRVLQPLAFLPADGETAPRWEYRFPTVAGVRYEGEPGRVPDADRLDVDRSADGAIPARVELALVVADGAPDVLALDSPSHPLSVSAHPSGATVALREAARLDRDLVVRWSACESGIGVRLVEGPGLAGDDGRYGLLTITPPRVAPRGFARDLSILIDASGSMSGDPIRWAREIACDVLRGLEPGDRFEVLAFGERPRPLTAGVVEATSKALASAVSAVERLEAAGGTEMAKAVIEALRPLRDGSQRQVILVTDGYVGFEAEVTRQVLRNLPESCRVHAVGIGAAPNRTLTRGVARAGRGVEVLIGGGDEVASAARRLRQATARPVLTGIRVSGDALRVVQAASLRDVLAGQPLVVPVELAANGGTIEVSGSLAGESEPWRRRVEVSGPPSPLPLGALFGREAIADAESRQAADVAIEALGLRHRIASRLTSLVAVAEEPGVDPLAPRRRERLPVEIPAGLSAEGLGLGLAGSALALMQVAREALEFRMAYSPAHEGIDTVPLRGSQPPSPPPPTAVSMDGTILAMESDTLVVEIQVPQDGFVLPGEATVHFPDWGSARGTIVRERSSPVGPHRAGRVIRFALRFHHLLFDPPPRPRLIVWEVDSRGGTVTGRFEIVAR